MSEKTLARLIIDLAEFGVHLDSKTPARRVFLAEEALSEKLKKKGR